jgi:hypothetical protein
LAAQEKHAIAVAMIAYMQRNDNLLAISESDCQPRETADGWEVYIQPVGGQGIGKASPVAGNFSVVHIDRKWKVIRIVGGA